MMFKLLLEKSEKQLIILLSFGQKDRELGHFKALLRHQKVNLELLLSRLVKNTEVYPRVTLIRSL